MASTRHPLPDWLGPAAAVARWTVHSNLLVSLAATGAATTTSVLVDAPLDPLALFVVFAATLFVYGADRVTDADADAANLPARASFARRHGRRLLAAGVVLYAAAVALAATRDVPHVEFVALPVVAVAVYSGLRAKRVFLVKNLLVGAAWAAVPLGVGAYAHQLGDPHVWLLAGWTGAVITVAAVVFDVKDVDGDAAAGIRTVPVVYDPATARRAAAAANVVLAAAVAVLVAASVLPARFLVLLALHAYVAAYVPFATPDRSALFYGLVVDGEHVALAVLAVALDAGGFL
ncbi:UbiA family prenyltransferase [Halobacterium rubrum]|uniref:UbiA family prenyltransferase n=1 Tax=Halobacterium TaxID=2239 RepID=UPI001F00B140|nr:MULTISPECIES: UbiA family prenyltransferase [Halobacterium]MDH5020181.1 UbiA family prenyltransferase [Halobacterium rubrum]